MQQLHYQQLGNINNKPLIFLHGLFGSGRNLQSIAKYFDDEYDIFLMDLRNHGSSFHNHRMDYERMSADLDDFITEMAIDSPILIGHSMGGKVAMTQALQIKNPITAVIVLDIAPINYGIDYIPLIDSLLAMELDKYQSRNEADEELAKTYSNVSFRQFLLQNLIRVDNRLQWRLNLPAIKENIDCIKSFPNFDDKTFQGPSLFLKGENSDYVQKQSEEKIMQFFPKAEIKTIANAGHWLHAEQPQLVINEIKDFLNSLK